ncbi:hypothetical protein PR048_021236 [Dryococelus australis]|uniref:Uncharacterized protein n=1 Tax=Dryococelus australis TaxID=614101 RepID=A0ABQ9GXL4_9NEOP|nr:hypothetical protein PR048_021236 [Dryococelus australis]
MSERYICISSVKFTEHYLVLRAGFMQAQTSATETLLVKKVIKANVTRAEKAVDKLTSGDVSATTVHQKRVHFMLNEVDKLLIGFNIDASGEESKAHDEDLGEVQD